ncbi:Protein hunchback [Pseudolycoriella hygida]|uniref:Protein hunchback n=1 Tax=Pseudolycoriella hygida TaxID=35572 RepID=A0A9Q0RWF9_9DIPT|nr:Protein hunchback [Pseudolycoriella hygida]
MRNGMKMRGSEVQQTANVQDRTQAPQSLIRGLNPLTPPGYMGIGLSMMSDITIRSMSFTTSPCHTSPCHTSPRHTSPRHTSPRHTSPCHTSPCHTSPADQVETPPKSPNSIGGTPYKNGEFNVNLMNGEINLKFEEEIWKPRFTAQGKLKMNKCKHCTSEFDTKADLWRHVECHLRPEKILRCPRCPFVTEYKHHLEYHILKHYGVKPIKCPSCDYVCANRSMLVSHNKSHSNVYPFRCANCNFVTKYMHSLKIHLRKLNHDPQPVLNPDGTPSTSVIIDVYGTRRGPKNRSTPFDRDNTLQLLAAQTQAAFAQARAEPSSHMEDHTAENADSKEIKKEPNEIQEDTEEDESEGEQNNNTHEIPDGLRNQFDRLLSSLYHECKHCGIVFKDPILHTIHMGYHGRENVFQCNLCGEHFEERVGFFTHIARKEHR